jgi:RNA polymerase sigma factor (sigma-70 family)
MDVHAAAPEAAPSFVTLIEPHLDYLYAFARKLCGERMAAEDLVQDTLLRAFRAQDSLRNRERPRYWLTKVLLSASADQWRKDAPHEHDVPLEDERFSLFDTLVEEDPIPYCTSTFSTSSTTTALRRRSSAFTPRIAPRWCSRTSTDTRRARSLSSPERPPAPCSRGYTGGASSWRRHCGNTRSSVGC